MVISITSPKFVPPTGTTNVAEPALEGGAVGGIFRHSAAGSLLRSHAACANVGPVGPGPLHEITSRPHRPLPALQACGEGAIHRCIFPLRRLPALASRAHWSHTIGTWKLTSQKRGGGKRPSELSKAPRSATS